MVDLKEKRCYVRGKWISFSREAIDAIFNLQKRKDGSKFKKLMENTNYEKILELLTGGKGE